MSDDPGTTPRPKLRPGGGTADHRPTPAAGVDPPRPDGRWVPVRLLLLAGLVVLPLLAAFRPGGVAAVIGVPLAATLPGAVLQPRYLPGLHTDLLTRWFLRVALSLATWALVGLAVGAAGVPVRSVWPVVVAVVLLTAVVIGEPEGGRRFGVVPARAAGWGVLVVVAAAVLAFGARGLVAVGGGTTGPGTPVAVTVSFADPTVPLSLTATGAQATARVVLTNTGDDDLTLTLGGQVGRSLPWPTVEIDLAAGATRVVDVAGGVPVCSDPQQAIVTIVGAGDLAPLSTVVPGAAGGIACAAG